MSLGTKLDMLTCNSPHSAKIYVGNPLTIFTISRSSLEVSPFLSGLLAYNAANGWYVMAPLLSSINGDDFRPVAEFLEYNEYHPHILDEGTDHVRLADITSDEEEQGHIIQCGICFKLGQKLELPGLQELAFRKLKVLQPYPPYEFLVVVGLAFGKTLADEIGLDGFLVQYFAVRIHCEILARFKAQISPSTSQCTLIPHFQLKCITFIVNLHDTLIWRYRIIFGRFSMLRKTYSYRP